MRKMVPSESFNQIEVLDFTYSLSDFSVNPGGYCYVDLDISHIPNGTIVMCKHEIDIAMLSANDLKNDILSKIYIDDTRNDNPNVVTIYFLNATLPQDDVVMTFRLYTFHKTI